MQNMMVKSTMDDMMLKQLGADTACFHGLQCFVKFNIEGYEISYAYNINDKDKYFLQRIKPYPMAAGVFENVKDAVDAIKTDVDQFKNAIRSGNFETFLNVNRQMLEVVRNVEDLFLYYNVDKNQLEELSAGIDMLKGRILKLRDESPRIYFAKDPDSL